MIKEVSLTAVVTHRLSFFNSTIQATVPEHYRAEVVSGLEEVNVGGTHIILIANGDTAGDARKALFEQIKQTGLKGTVRFVRSEEPSIDLAPTPDSPLTEKQFDYLCNMLKQMDKWNDLVSLEIAKLSRKQASDRIEEVKRQLIGFGDAQAKIKNWKPRDNALAPSEQAKPQWQPVAGMYKIGERIFKVQKAIYGSGGLYAKELLKQEDGKFKFEHVKGIMRQLKEEHKLTIEEAKAFGALYGTCCVCGRTLTDENSIKEGIGPICASKF